MNNFITKKSWRENIDNFKKCLKKYFYSFDFGVSFLVLIILLFIINDPISNQIAKNIYDTGISVLSIIFSVYFATLSIVISSSDNSFIRFLEQENYLYSELLNLYKFSLLVIFISLVFSLISYGITLYLEQIDCSYPKCLFIFFIFFFTWSLLSSLSIGLITLKYAKKRGNFLLDESDNIKNN